MVEVVVRQQNMANLSAGESRDILGDRLRLGKSRAGVDEQDFTSTVDNPDGDVAEPQPAAEHMLRDLFPCEIQRSVPHLCEATP